MTDFLTADTNLPSYMMFPHFLLDMEINETAKMLYIILLDRARLSQKNEGWSDTDGHVFIYFTIEALAEVLHKSQMTVKTALTVLEKQELIFRKRQGPGQPNRIYVKLPKETIHYTDRFLSLRQTENCPIDRQNSFPDTDRKLLWSSIFVTLMANKIGGLQFGIYRNCQISSRVFHTAVAALPLTKANRSDFE